MPRPARRWLAALSAALLPGLALVSPPAAVAAAAPSDVALQVSFDQGATVRLRAQRLVSQRARAAGSALDAVLARHHVVRVERVFRASEARLDDDRRRLVRDGLRDVPDLNRHYRIFASDRAERDQLLADLRGMGIVDQVIAEPEPVPPPVTPDFTAQQRYKLAAPIGIGTAAAAGLGGGLGQNVKIIDIEYSWNQEHEDLAASADALIPNGTPDDPFDDTNHGTAVLGELISTVNAFGVSGLAPGSDIGLVNANTTDTYDVPGAVDVARANLSPGDVMLLEQQYQGIAGTGTFGADDYVPSEYWPAAYDAIKLATQEGIIVVEAAGNSGVDTDDPAYEQPFPRGEPDSGAIIVGAGAGEPTAPCTGTRNSRLSFSTYGARVNLQGWGQCVTTTGYGSLYNTGGPNFFYRSTFNGTSSASPIVAAAAALYSSVFQATTGGRAPTPQAVRKRLVDTGTAQAASPSGHIGPLPNVAAAATGFDFTPPTVSVTGEPASPTSNATPVFTFAASEARLDARVSRRRRRVLCVHVALHDGPCARRNAYVRGQGHRYRAESRAGDGARVHRRHGRAGGDDHRRPVRHDDDRDPDVHLLVERARRGVRVPRGDAAGPRRVRRVHVAAHDLRPGRRGELFEVQATDAAGNPGPVASRGFTVAVPPPPPPPVPPPPPPPATPPQSPELAPPAAISTPPTPPPAALAPAAPVFGPGAKLDRHRGCRRVRAAGAPADHVPAAGPELHAVSDRPPCRRRQVAHRLGDVHDRARRVRHDPLPAARARLARGCDACAR